MKDFFGTIWHGVCILNPAIIILSLFNFIIIMGLNVLHKRLKKNGKKMTVWRLLCLLPLVISLIHFFILYYGTEFNEIIAILYIPAVFSALWSLSANKKVIYYISGAIINFSAIISLLLCSLFGSYQCGNFTRMSYTDSFKATVEEIKKHYVLTEWKETDFDAVEAEILPLVEEAEKNKDKAAFAAALGKFRSILHDGHINMYILDDKVKKEFTEKHTGNDYGFSMITLENGDTIAVVTDKESSAYSQGIHDGTKIIKWNDVPVDEAKAHAEYTAVKTTPVASNEEFMKASFLAGMGGDTISVTFIADSGKEKNITLQKSGNYYERFSKMASELFSADKTDGDNYSTRMVSDTCGYILVNKEHYNMYDLIAYATGNHIPVRKMFLEKLNQLRDQGMKTLIIDLRNNGGGYDDVSLGWASLFADKEYYGFSLADKSHKSICNHYIIKSGEYADLKVAVLVNLNCISAGDGTALYLSRLPNVTVLGMTDPNGSNQETGGRCYVSDGLAVIYYPIGLVTDESGNPNIDVSADRVSRNPADVHIPLTYDAAMKIFSQNKDYELEYAIDYLKDK